jgi:DNA-binding beta-propeller fold protein YncE
MEIDGTTLEVRRSAEIEPLRSAAISLAKFGHSASGPVNRRAVATPEGRTVLAAGRGGVAAIDTAELRLTDRYLAGQAVEAVGLTPDGAVLYVLLRDRGRIVALDAATGNPIGEVPGEGYDRLLAVVPG